MPDLSEEWRPVPGYSGAYEVSSFGRVRSVDRIYTDSVGRIVPRRGRLLTPQTSKDGTGRLYVKLTGGKVKRVHTLVALAFLGPRPEGLVVCHGDGNPANNRLGNLRYDSYKENSLDMVRHGRSHEAAKTHCPRGHEYSAANTYDKPRPDGRNHRRCRICANECKQRARRLANVAR